MRVVFDLDFDGGYWPGPLGGRPDDGGAGPLPPGRRASAGESWAGPSGFLGILETALGLGGPGVPPGVRAASLLRAVAEAEGFWSASAAADPLGTARALLEWRDELSLHGWRGQPLAPRLDALARVCRSALPGLPDRLSGVAAALPRRRSGVAEVVLVGERAELPLLWRNVLGLLEAGGTSVKEMPQAENAAPRVRLWRPDGPLEAAEACAAWLASPGAGDGVVVVGADALLDDALHRHGLPVTGAASPRRDNALLQVLPLAVALGWAPPDPQRAMELLSLPLSPVPPALARHLAGALRQWPAVDSDAWREALATGLGAVEDPERREQVRDRLGVLFSSPVPRADRAYPAAEARRRARTVNRWLRGRAAAAPEGEAECWQAAVAQTACFLESLDACGLAELPETLLQRLLEDSAAAAPEPPARSAEAGIASVGGPGGVAGPARTVLWWDFTQASAPPPRRLPFSRAEREALAAAGTPLPEPWRLAAWRSRRWRRPADAAREHLALVCPRTDAAGAESHPHPLWDELSAPGGNTAAASPETTAVARSLRAIPGPRRRWRTAPGAVGRRDRESPSSLETLAGCPFRWALAYAGRLREAAGALPGPGSRDLAGSLAHHVLAETLRRGAGGPEAAAGEARRLFESEGPRLAAPFFLPGAEGERAALRRLVEEAARTVAALLARWGKRVLAVETPFRQPFGDGELEGTPDLVVGAPPAVVDFKHAGASYRSRALQEGAACQLAAYARLVGGGAAPVPAAYFVLSGRRLLSGDPAAFPGCEPVEGPALDETWNSLLAALDKRRAEMDAGVLLAEGVAATPGDAAEETALKPFVGAPCPFCAFGPLCGLTFGGEA